MKTSKMFNGMNKIDDKVVVYQSTNSHELEKKQLNLNNRSSFFRRRIRPVASIRRAESYQI